MGNNFKILVVDDTPANLEVITETLSSVGYTVATAIDGERALNRLKTYVPDLILLDVQMPGIDGFETCKQIKENPNTANIPVIFITALSDIGSMVRGFSLGAVDYISKPFQELELLTRVKTHLQLGALTQDLERQVAERTAELQATLAELRQSRVQLVQHEKMSALGNLVAGIAHEINNPIGFLNGSLSHARAYTQDLLGHLELYQQHCPDGLEKIQENAQEIELDFLCEDLPKLLESMQGATDRIRDISTSLRTFSRADTEYKVSADLHEGIDSTLLILKYRLKASDIRPDIEVIKEYGELPAVTCFPGQLNQVFMNILANAIDAFDEAAEQGLFQYGSGQTPKITIKTSVLSVQNVVEIRIRDNGKGMTEEVKAKAFDHLFTTKEMGKGTGLGLAIAHQIVTETHYGSLTVESECGQGTEFCLQLPID
jgi:signal transduction histidine kinase